MRLQLRTGRSIRVVLALALCVVLGAVSTSHASWVVYNVTLNGASESPPNASLGTGTALVGVNAATNQLYIHLDFAGLSGTTTACHIHAATAVAGTGTAGVATTTPFFAGFPIGVTSATGFDITLDETLASSWNPAYVTANGGSTASAEAALFAAIAAGKAYLNVHTAAPLGVPGGEIRGFLVPAQVPTEPTTWGKVKALYK
ncbi:MAG TPA: CHRD domain-containing protein [Candidatus Krumholzibacteria bacterium]|nr:CHRD domain-containing protein [Candidatus Krumholzibacteria bacterium]